MQKQKNKQTKKIANKEQKPTQYPSITFMNSVCVCVWRIYSWKKPLYDKQRINTYILVICDHGYNQKKNC